MTSVPTRQSVSLPAVLRPALRLDRDGLDVAAGVRVAVAVTAPLVVGLAAGHVLDGVVAALGAFNVALAEGVGRYSDRSSTLVLGWIGSTLGTGVGSLLATVGWGSVPALFAIVLVCAYAGVLGPTIERTGWFTVVMTVIGLGLPDPSVVSAGRYAGWVAVGGAWAIVVVVALWPMHPHRPEYRALARQYAALADLLRRVADGSGGGPGELDPAIARVETLGHQAGALTRWRSVHHRGSTAVLARLRRISLEGERVRTGAVLLARGEQLPPPVRETVRGLADVAQEVADRLRHDKDPGGLRPAGLGGSTTAPAPLHLVTYGLEAVTGAASSGDLTSAVPAARSRPTVLAQLRASLTPRAFWFRYAVRFAVAAALGLTLARGFGLEKGYWVLMTVAVVVKPQLSLSTTSVVLRVAGTVVGVVLGGALVAAIPTSAGLIVAAFVLGVLSTALSRVNYGLGVAFLTPMILVMLNVPRPGQWEIADVRLLNTLIGAAVGLLATLGVLRGTERGLVAERARGVLERDAAYLRSLTDEDRDARQSARTAARVATDDLLAVIDRAMAEVPTPRPQVLAAGTAFGAAAAQLWEAEAALALVRSSGRAEDELHARTRAAADQVDALAARLGGSGAAGPSAAPAGPPPNADARPPDRLGPALEAMRAAVDELDGTAAGPAPATTR